MKATVIREPHIMEVIERPIPVPAENEVLVRVRSVGICGSDTHGFLGLSGKRRLPGLVMGHEASGEIAAVGSGVCTWNEDDRVAIDSQVACRHCYPCIRGWISLCDNMSVIGSSMRSFKDGAMQEYMILNPVQLNKLPDNMSFNEGAMLDPVSNSIHLFNRAEMEASDNVAIIGTGAIGLIMVQVAD